MLAAAIRIRTAFCEFAENDASTRASALRICYTGDLATLLISPPPATMG